MGTFAAMLRRMREERDLSLRDLAGQIHCDPGYLSKLERGTKLPSEELARVVDTRLIARGELIASAALDRAARKDINPLQTVELLNRIRRADASLTTLESLQATVFELCCRYVSDDAAALRSEAQELLGSVAHLLRRPVGLRAHTELLVQTGWLALLIGCLEYDLGLRSAAEHTRQAAQSLGAEADAAEIIGWSHEMSCWFDLTTGRYERVLSHAADGLSVAPSHSVTLQLIAQRAKALARLQRVDDLRRTLDQGEALLEQLTTRKTHTHHFSVDPAKWPFYAMDAYRLAGDDVLASEYARVVLTTHMPGGATASPMRVSEAQLTLAVVAARRGDLETAVSTGLIALSAGRKSLPSLHMVAGELDSELELRFPHEQATGMFRSALREIG